MRNVGILPLLIVVTAIGAQEKPPRSAQLAPNAPANAMGSCPVGLVVRLVPRRGATVVQAAAPPAQTTPGGATVRLNTIPIHNLNELHITADVRARDGDERRLLKVGVMLHGWSGVPHLRPVGGATDGDISEEAQLGTGAGTPASSFRTDVWPMTMTMVSSLEVTWVKYGDGSTWKKTGEDSCEVRLIAPFEKVASAH